MPEQSILNVQYFVQLRVEYMSLSSGLLCPMSSSELSTGFSSFIVSAFSADFLADFFLSGIEKTEKNYK
jgi:hypothetical protein